MIVCSLYLTNSYQNSLKCFLFFCFFLKFHDYFKTLDVKNILHYAFFVLHTFCKFVYLGDFWTFTNLVLQVSSSLGTYLAISIQDINLTLNVSVLHDLVISLVKIFVNFYQNFVNFIIWCHGGGLIITYHQTEYIAQSEWFHDECANCLILITLHKITLRASSLTSSVDVSFL